MHAEQYPTAEPISHPTCVVCRKAIDPAFDSMARDADGFPCHATCRTKAAGGPRAYGVNMPLEVGIWLVSWPVGLARWIARSHEWSVRKATWIVATLQIVAIVAYVAITMAEPAKPEVGMLNKSISTEVASYYTKLVPLGTTVDVTKAVCGDAIEGAAKCSVDLITTQDGASQEGHVDVSVTDAKGDGTYRWMPLGVTGPAFEDN